MTMSAYEAYQHYLALKQHFSKKDYDYFKYNGKVRANPKAFDTRPDKVFFAKLAKHPDPIFFLVANLLENDKAWIRDIAYGEDAKRVYQDWVRRTQSLTYNFKGELDKLDPDFDSNFKVENNSHPKLLKLYLRKEISLETLMLLVSATECKQYWDRKMQYDPIWENVSTKIVKYQPFLKYDLQQIRKIVVDKFGGTV
jgi:hypothetical protein